MTRRRLAAIGAAVASLALLTSGAASAANNHELITGSGSSWSAVAVNQWIADVEANGLKVVFTANGSAAGRKDFALKTTNFGVTDIGYQGTNPETGDSDTSNGRAYAYLPITGGGTAFPYHIEVAGKLYRDLRLSGDAIAKIFTNQITNWNDPEITRDNNGVQLPDLPIIPVVHSEGAGVTAEFTLYLAQLFPNIWGPFNGGKNTFTEFYPVKGNTTAQNGSDGVMNYVTSSAANGAIGMDEYAYPLAKNFPAAKLQNAAGYFTLPTQYNVAVALTQAIINNDPTSPNYLLQDLKNVYTYNDPRTYALSSYAYAIIPTASDDKTMDTGRRQTLSDFLYYSICQGQSEIGPIGYSSLPVNLVTAGFAQIGKLKTADPNVDLTQRDVSTCNNPTFIAGHPDQNYLAKIAPQPVACDKSGAGPCVGGVAPVNTNPSPTAKVTTTPGKGGATTAPATSGATTAPGSVDQTVAPPTDAVATQGPQIVTDPLTGQPVAVAPTTSATDGNGAGSGAGAPTVTQLAQDGQSSMTSVMAPTAAVLLLVALLAPALAPLWLRRRRLGPAVAGPAAATAPPVPPATAVPVETTDAPPSPAPTDPPTAVLITPVASDAAAPSAAEETTSALPPVDGEPETDA